MKPHLDVLEDRLMPSTTSASLLGLGGIVSPPHTMPPVPLVQTLPPTTLPPPHTMPPVPLVQTLPPTTLPPPHTMPPVPLTGGASFWLQ